MNFAEKFNSLLVLTGINQSKLARELNVDASLVSRWRNGQRSPVNSQESILSIANAFARRIQMKYQCEALSALIGHTIGDTATTKDLAEEILFWLNRDNAIFVEFITTVHNAKEVAEPEVEKHAAARHSMPAHGGSKTITLVMGEQASVQSFIAACLENPQHAALMLYCDETGSWMEYAVTYLKRAYARCPQLGSLFREIHMILPHGVYAENIATYFDFIAPFAKTAAINIYSHKHYQRGEFQSSLVIAEGTALVTSFGFARQDDSATYLVTDKPSVEQYAREFMELCKRCETLVTLRDRRSGIQVITEMIRYIQIPADTVYEGNAVPPIMLPDGMVGTLVKKIVGDKKTANRLIWSIMETKKEMANFLENNKYTLYMPLYTPREAEEGAVSMVGVPRSLEGRPFFAPADYLQMLLHLDDLMNRFPNLSLQVIAPVLHDYCHYVKPEFDVYAAHIGADGAVYHSTLPRVSRQMHEAIKHRYRAIPQKDRTRKANRAALKSSIRVFRQYLKNGKDAL